ncbi:MAG: GNAT family N-acetyltransferase [Microlunatus sp.]|nr:GNAT family N-acetyltransferase [Microlunatus sp.]
MNAAVRFTTRELSMRTIDDFEQFFSQVHGCACTLYFFGRHLSPLPGTAQQRAERLGSAPDRSRKHFPHQELMRTREAAAVRELVSKGQAHGILVYANGEPVGWCHFGRVDELPVPSEESNPDMIYARDPTTDWVIDCFTTRMDHRRQGVATRALNAAVAAITKRGGGWIEAVPMAFPYDDPKLRKLRRTYRWRSPQVAEYLRDNWPSKDVPGIGEVSACLNSSRTMGHMGTMSMFEKAGFTPTRRDEHRSATDPYHRGDFVVMRRHV